MSVTDPLQAGVDHAELDWQVDYHAVVAVSARLQREGLLDSAKAVERMLSRAASYKNCRDAHMELDALRAAPVLPDRGWRPDREAVALWLLDHGNDLATIAHSDPAHAIIAAFRVTDAILALPDAPAEGAE